MMILLRAVCTSYATAVIVSQRPYFIRQVLIKITLSTQLFQTTVYRSALGVSGPMTTMA